MGKKCPSKTAQMMASNQIMSLLLLSALVSASTATFQWPPYHYEPAPLCECINPFLGTKNHYRGDPEALCSDFGPGFCYVECSRACSDEKPTASRGRCQSTLACAVHHGDILAVANPDVVDVVDIVDVRTGGN